MRNDSKQNLLPVVLVALGTISGAIIMALLLHIYG